MGYSKRSGGLRRRTGKTFSFSFRSNHPDKQKGSNFLSVGIGESFGCHRGRRNRILMNVTQAKALYNFLKDECFDE